MIGWCKNASMASRWLRRWVGLALHFFGISLLLIDEVVFERTTLVEEDAEVACADEHYAHLFRQLFESLVLLKDGAVLQEFIVVLEALHK